MGNPWEDFSMVGMGLRSLNPVGLYPLPSLVASPGQCVFLAAKWAISQPIVQLNGKDLRNRPIRQVNRQEAKS
jgi:hypothetical protein